MDALAVVLPLALLFLYASRFLKKKTSAVARNYDVCLSYGGGDNRTGFADFVYNSLLASGIRVFRDDDALRVGEQIGQEHLQAIRGCRIAIPIISKEYAHSTWCLRQLAEIMDCHTKHGKSVFPIFYEVDVVDVDRQRGNFEGALREHERKNCPEVREWREALSSVARIKGWISQTDVGEADLVELVRERVSSELKRTWIERLPMITRSVPLHLLQKKRRESKCRVFLAFRGLDARYSLAAYLHAALEAAGIGVFNDDDPSLIGRDVAHEISNAIDHSEISIPILSENFTSSRWCLDDLAQMVDCKRAKGQKILPIFYKVKPSQVQDATHCLRTHLLHPENESTLELWERALWEVGCCEDGWESEQIADGHEGVLVREVVEEVSRLLNNPQIHDPNLLPPDNDAILESVTSYF